MIRLLLAVFLVMIPLAAFAQAPAATEVLLQEALKATDESTGKKPESPMESTLWIFFVGTGLIAIAGFVLTQWKARQNLILGNDMQVVHSLNLSPKQRLVIVEFEGTRLLLAVSDSGIALLKTLDEEPKEPEPQSKSDLWLAALRGTAQTNPSPKDSPQATEHSGLFAQMDARPAVKTNRESDSVLIGLKSLEAKSRATV